MKYGRSLRKKFTWALVVAMLCGSLAGCGGKGQAQDGDGQNGSSPTEAAVWVSEYVSLDGEGFNPGKTWVDGDHIYFMENFRDEATGMDRHSIAAIALPSGSKEQALAPEDWRIDTRIGAGRACEACFRTQDGGFVTLEGMYSGNKEESAGEYNNPAEYYLCRYDSGGQRVEERDLTEQLAAEGRQGSLGGSAMDGEGRLYFAMNDGRIHLVDAEGNYSAQMLPGGEDDHIHAICTGRSGKVYVVQSRLFGAGGGWEYVIKELDFDKREVAAVFRNYPCGVPWGRLTAGAEQELLVYDGTDLYGYSTVDQDYVKLLSWVDSGVSGDSVICVHAMEDGRILAVQREQGKDMELAFLTPKKVDEVAEKETITIACLQKTRQLDKIAAKFNKRSNRYHVEIKEYMEEHYTSESFAEVYQDADLRLNADLISDHSPDLLLWENYFYDGAKLAEKGLFEDLDPWLEASARYSREDFFPQALEAGTYNGTLVTIPKTFSLVTMVGRAAELGTEPGWTMEEMIAYADAHPDARLFDHMSKRVFLESMLARVQGSFVDWGSGECRFESDEFIKVLRMTEPFPIDASWNPDDDPDATPYKLRDGRVLLYAPVFNDFYETQIVEAVFFGDELNYIGYPGEEGERVTYLDTGSGLAMLAGSSHKEGAWAFLEDYLAGEESLYQTDFPTNKKAFQEASEAAFAGKKPREDEGGPVTTWGWLNWESELHNPTQREADVVLSLLETARPFSNTDRMILKIILEEADPYFQGQKSAEAVAKIIQNRVQLYVNENR